MARGLIPGRGRDFSLHHCVQMGSGAYTSSSLMGIGVPFSGGKMVRV